jgi:hypothetical protein
MVGDRDDGEGHPAVPPPAPPKDTRITFKTRPVDPRRESPGTIPPEIIDPRLLLATGVTDAVRERLTAPPPVPTDVEAKAAAFAEELRYCGPDHVGNLIGRVLALGPEAIPPIARKFPGALWFDRRAPYHKPPPGRNVSAISKVLVEFGPPAEPWVAGLLEAEHSDIRFYAVLVAEDLGPRLLMSLGRLAFDEDEGVRGLALDAVARMGRAPGWDSLFTTLVSAAENRSVWLEFRIHAVQGLAALDDPACRPTLEALADDPEPALRAVVRRALERTRDA